MASKVLDEETASLSSSPRSATDWLPDWGPQLSLSQGLWSLKGDLGVLPIWP